jgi:diguanylate cyclase (GGDEF)-like protein
VVLVLRRALAALRRGGTLSPTGSAYAVPVAVAPGDGADRRTLDDLVAVAPDMRRVLLARARDSGLLVGVVSAAVLPAWTFVDRLLAPREVDLFLAVRLLGDIPIVLLTAVLAVLPLGRRRPEALTFAVLVVVQVETAWMVPLAQHGQFYAMGVTLALYACGCVLVVRPRWTVALLVTTWAALAASLLSAGSPPLGNLAVGTLGYVGTASLISLLAHLRRHATTVSELGARLRLEHEQRRTRALLDRLDRLSHEDPLTGLANRRRWDVELAGVCAEVREHGGVVSVLLVDLDRFKRVNDAYGHPGGDEVLRQVADVLTGAVRGEDLVARLGGDELAVLLPGADELRAVALAEAVRGAAATLRPEGFAAGEVSVSVGVAVAEGAEAYPVELQSRADEQLYRAKITRNAVGGPQPARPVVPAARQAGDAC